MITAPEFPRHLCIPGDEEAYDAISVRKGANSAFDQAAYVGMMARILFRLPGYPLEGQRYFDDIAEDWADCLPSVDVLQIEHEAIEVGEGLLSLVHAIGGHIPPHHLLSLVHMRERLESIHFLFDFLFDSDKLKEVLEKIDAEVKAKWDFFKNDPLIYSDPIINALCSQSGPVPWWVEVAYKNEHSVVRFVAAAKPKIQRNTRVIDPDDLFLYIKEPVEAGDRKPITLLSSKISDPTPLYLLDLERQMRQNDTRIEMRRLDNLEKRSDWMYEKFMGLYATAGAILFGLLLTFVILWRTHR